MTIKTKNRSVMKKLKTASFLILLLLVTSSLFGCGNLTDKTNNKNETKSVMKKIATTLPSEYVALRTMYDKELKVVYVNVSRDGGSTATSVLYNSDGSVRTYTGSKNDKYKFKVISTDEISDYVSIQTVYDVDAKVVYLVSARANNGSDITPMKNVDGSLKTYKKN